MRHARTGEQQSCWGRCARALLRSAEVEPRRGSVEVVVEASPSDGSTRRGAGGAEDWAASRRSYLTSVGARMSVVRGRIRWAELVIRLVLVGKMSRLSSGVELNARWCGAAEVETRLVALSHAKPAAPLPPSVPPRLPSHLRTLTCKSPSPSMALFDGMLGQNVEDRVVHSPRDARSSVEVGSRSACIEACLQVRSSQRSSDRARPPCPLVATSAVGAAARPGCLHTATFLSRHGCFEGVSGWRG